MKRLYILLLISLFNYEAIAQKCETISREVDKFNGNVSFHMSSIGTYRNSPNEGKSSPYLRKAYFSKVIARGVSHYYLSLKAYNNTIVSRPRGVIIILDNGQKINKPNQEIDVEVNDVLDYQGGSYEYSSFIRLSPIELNIFKGRNITDIRLYVFDEEMDKEDQEEIRVLFNCMLNGK